MATRGRPPKPDVERRPCPLEGHGRREVVLDGLVKDKDGTATHQRFRCWMGTSDELTFRVPLAGKTAGTAGKAGTRPAVTPVSATCARRPAGTTVPSEPTTPSTPGTC